YPIPQTIRVKSVEVCDNGVDFQAIRFFLFVDSIDYDAYRKQAIDLFKRNRLFARLVPNGMDRFWPAEYIRHDALFGKDFINWRDKIRYKTLTFRFFLVKLLGDKLIRVRIGVFHGQILKFGFDGRQS